jgi:hypothetical protein
MLLYHTRRNEPMLYRLLADLLVLLHLIFVLFVVAGGLLVLRRPRVALLHLPVAAWGAFVELSGRLCPLTPLEVRFRVLGGEAGYSGGFVEHYLLPVLYPVGLDRLEQIWLGVSVIVLNLAIYLVFAWRRTVPGRGREGSGENGVDGPRPGPEG